MVGGVEIIDTRRLNSTKIASPPAIHINLVHPCKPIVQFRGRTLQVGQASRPVHSGCPSRPIPESGAPRSIVDFPRHQARRPPLPLQPVRLPLVLRPAPETDWSARRAAGYTDRNTGHAGRTAI